MDNPPAIKTWGEWFERRSRYYKDPLLKIAYYVNGRPLPLELMEATIDDVWRKLIADSRCSLLDVGGGPGLFTKTFKSRLKYIVTTDISFSMVKAARRLNPEPDFLTCEAARLPFKSGTFDRLLCYSVFHYFPDLSYARRTLTEFIRVVKNNGLMLVGDVPSDSAVRIKDDASRGDDAKKRRRYPRSLKHNLKYTVFNQRFFIDFCKTEGVPCGILEQNIKNKPTAGHRFDVLIKVVK